MTAVRGMAVLALCAGITAASWAAEASTAGPVQRWGMFEVALHNAHSYANPFTDVSLDATLTGPAGYKLAVPGFYDGNHTWRLRFMPTRTGVWHYEAKFSDGTPGAAGEFRCVAGKLPGPLRVDKANPWWFEYADGKPFYLRAFHLWDGEHLSDAVLAKTLAFLKQQHFDAIVGPHLSPSTDIPWQTNAKGKVDFSRFNLAVWHKLDHYAVEAGRRGMIVIPFSIFGGTNGMPKIPERSLEVLFLRYWVGRWGGYWNITFQPTSEWEEGFAEEHIMRILSQIFALDGGRHLISVHSWKAGTLKLEKAKFYDYITVQDKLTKYDPIKYTWFVGLHHKVPKPILAQECLWEGNLYQKKPGLDINNLRRGAWVIALCGGQLNYGDEVGPHGNYQVSTVSSEDTYSELGAATTPHGHFWPQLKIMGDFMQSLHWWEMAPAPKLSSTGVCLADPGETYVAYTLKGGTVTLDLSGAKERLVARWFNPRDGHYGPAMEVQGGGKWSAKAPDGEDWVLVVRRR